MNNTNLRTQGARKEGMDDFMNGRMQAWMDRWVDGLLQK